MYTIRTLNMTSRGISGIGKAREPVSLILSFCCLLCPLTRTLLDGKKVRKYHTVANQTTQYDTNQYAGGYQPTPYDATAGLEVGMGAMNLQQQPADTYNTGASNYATWPTDAQAQGRSPVSLTICTIQVVNKI